MGRPVVHLGSQRAAHAQRTAGSHNNVVKLALPQGENHDFNIVVEGRVAAGNRKHFLNVTQFRFIELDVIALSLSSDLGHRRTFRLGSA